MGIRGLTSFMKGIRAVWTSTCLSSTKLVIDGNNLLFHLYISSGLDMQCGGQYLEYYQLIRVFFSTLKKHHIEAVVVLDGVDEGDLKLPTRRKRANEKIGKAQTFDCVPPLFIEQVFFQAAADSDVELKMCDYEGDTVAAQLANSLCCPVLSNDSDFYILDIRLGLIPINTFEWQQNGGPIRCQSYHRDAFLRHINLSDEFLPLLAVLVGNDLTNEDQLKPLHRYMTGNASHLNSRDRRISTVISWLSQYHSVRQAEADLMARVSKGRDKFATILEKSRASIFCFSDCSVRIIDGSAFPDWVIKSFKAVRFSKIAVQAASCGRIMMHVQMEDMKRPSAHSCSCPIRQIMYAILFKGTAYSQSKVIEIGRADGAVALKDYEIEIPVLSNVCSIAEIESMNYKEKLDILLSLAAGCDLNEFQKLDVNLRLPTVALYYWSHLATHQVSHKAIYAAIFSFIVCYLKFNQLVEQKRYCLDMPSSPMKEKCKQWDLRLGHHFAEFQSILYYIMILNSVLDFPLPDFNVAAVFNGLVAHRAASEYDTYEDFLYASENSQLFADICKLLGTQQDGTDSGSTNVAKGKGKGKNKEHVKPTIIRHTLGSRFARLGLDDDDSNDSDVELDVDFAACTGLPNAEKQREDVNPWDDNEHADQATDSANDNDDWITAGKTIAKKKTFGYQPAGKK